MSVFHLSSKVTAAHKNCAKISVHHGNTIMYVLHEVCLKQCLIFLFRENETGLVKSLTPFTERSTPGEGN